MQLLIDYFRKCLIVLRLLFELNSTDAWRLFLLLLLLKYHETVKELI